LACRYFRRAHSLQLPGGLGQRAVCQIIEPIARAGVACGVDGVFMEVHEAPERAPSDGPNMLPLDRMGALLKVLRDIHALISKQAGNLSREAGK
jgi:2-dehydro-3-deoxyphosphooctonate aldolase (KDO 8-P synthase)